MSNVWEQTQEQLKGVTPNGDYSVEGGETRKNRRDEIESGVDDQIHTALPTGDLKEMMQLGAAKSAVGGTFVNPGAANYGGDQGVAYYTEKGREGGARNDVAQSQNEANMYQSMLNGTTDRGQVAQENPFLAAREASARGQQLGGLDLSRQAAAGLAPSEAQFQTKLGMNDLAGQHSAQMGTARGLAGLSGAQMQGSAMSGSAAGNLAASGGLARSKEIGEAIGMYSTQAGDVAGQDAQRLQQNTKNSMFGAQLNDDWRIGNLNLAAAQGRLGVSQGNTDLAWMDEQMTPEEKQFEYDQRMAAVEAGADADKVAGSIARNREERNSKRQFVSGVATGVGGAVGTAVGGPVGGAVGGLGGAAFGKATEDLW